MARAHPPTQHRKLLYALHGVLLAGGTGLLVGMTVDVLPRTEAALAGAGEAMAALGYIAAREWRFHQESASAESPPTPVTLETDIGPSTSTPMPTIAVTNVTPAAWPRVEPASNTATSLADESVIMTGEDPLSERQRIISREVAAFSQTEMSILQLTAEAKTNKEIARILSYSEEHVRNTLSKVYEKLNVSESGQGINPRVAAVRQALRLGLVS